MNNKIFDYNLINGLSEKMGDSFYILDEDLFEDNFRRLLESFQTYYSNTNIAYSYKTNYLPNLCKCVKVNGGYAEVVSEMECFFAETNGMKGEDIFYNGPWKKATFLKEYLLKGVHVNLDGFYELSVVKELANEYPEKNFAVGLRVAVDIGQEEASRFGFCLENGDLEKAFEDINSLKNCKVEGLHLHLPYRMLDTYNGRMAYLKKVLDTFTGYEFKYISLGGGYMGEIPESMRKEFSFVPPTFEDYANIVARMFADFMSERGDDTLLLIEPGSALVANTMKLVTRVINIKQVRGVNIATLAGSVYQMNPSVKNVRRTISVYHGNGEHRKYDTLDMAGYTCIEGDYLYRGYVGSLAEGDFVVFDNVGSYSIVMKPPFILPDVPTVITKDGKIRGYVAEQKADSVYNRLVEQLL